MGTDLGLQRTEGGQRAGVTLVSVGKAKSTLNGDTKEPTR